MRELRVAFVPLARPTFDIQLAADTAAMARRRLMEAGLTLIGPSELVMDSTSAQEAAGTLAGEKPDLLLVFQATFADSSMVVALTGATDAPVILWAVPEPSSGGRLRLNSLCGINLAGHALTLRGIQYDYVYAYPDEAAPLDKVLTLARAGHVRNRLRNARLGVVGEHPPGLDTCRFDAPAIKSMLGVEIVQIDLEEVFARARAVGKDKISEIRHILDKKLHNLAHLDQTALSGTLSVYAALSQVAGEEDLDGLAVRCWPEFFTELGCAACGAMSMLSDELIPCSCEADVHGTITQMILQWVSGEAAFGSDLVTVDLKKNHGVMWHCGLAPLCMADPHVQPRGGIHSNRHLPLVMEYPLKPGQVTVARLSQATGELRLVLGRAEMLSAAPSFSGTSGVLRFENHISQILELIMRQGLEHHVSITYGDHTACLLALANLLGLSVLRL
jgi:L-fucose isomerase-like protein